MASRQQVTVMKLSMPVDVAWRSKPAMQIGQKQILSVCTLI